MNDQKILNIFYKSLENGDPGDHEPKHVERGYRLTEQEPGKYRLTFERHPHFFGKQSLGKESSAYKTVEYSYLIDEKSNNVEFLDEKLINVKISYDDLAEEDMEFVDFYHLNLSDVEEKLLQCKTDNEIVSVAKSVFDSKNWFYYLDNAEKEEVDKYFDIDKARQIYFDHFKEKFLECWRDRKKDIEDDFE